MVVVLQGMFLEGHPIFSALGLTARKILSDFWLWQIFTYFFVHAGGVFHILFNMFALWMFGSELERLWGSRFFLIYYLCCGVGAGLVYLLCLQIWLLFFQPDALVLDIPMIGASGAVFGVLLAYGLIFRERIVYFMMIFPIKAIYFILIIGLVEFVSLINSGAGGPVSHLAHLSGFAVGWAFLQIWRTAQNFAFKPWRKNRPSHLKMAENNDKEDPVWH